MLPRRIGVAVATSLGDIGVTRCGVKPGKEAECLEAAVDDAILAVGAGGVVVDDGGHGVGNCSDGCCY